MFLPAPGLSGKPVIKVVSFASMVLLLKRIMQLFTFPPISYLTGFQAKNLRATVPLKAFPSTTPSFSRK